MMIHLRIYDQRTVVSLSNESETKVAAKVFDSGSFDNCDDVVFSIGRGNTLDDYVSFTCEDLEAGVVMLRLRVAEKHNLDNYSECSIEVLVQDKLKPSLVYCPADVDIECGSDLSDLSKFGTPQFNDNCGLISNTKKKIIFLIVV